MVAPSSKIWVEIDDFIRMLDWTITPTGICRVQMELVLRLARNHPERIRLCAIGRTADDVFVISPDELGKLIEQTHAPSPASRLDTAIVRTRQFWRFLKRNVKTRTSPATAFKRQVQPGDVMVNLGAAWGHAGYADKIRQLKARHDIRFSVLIHDVLPISYPQFMSKAHVPNFTRWFLSMSEVWDLVLTPSVATAEDLARVLERHGRPVPPVHPLPFGAGFKTPEPDGQDFTMQDRPYVMFVSTIEIRKNHLLMVRVWEELIRRHGPENIPALLFVGRLGWEIDALRDHLAATDNLGGKVVIASSLGDAQVAQAYGNCLFTVFPSFCEGWGLPVTESLAHGKYCVASNATSIPEAGGAFADYFDPNDAGAALALVERAIFDVEYRQAKEAEIRASFVRKSWDDCADAIVGILTDRTGHAAAVVGPDSMTLNRHPHNDAVLGDATARNTAD